MPTRPLEPGQPSGPLDRVVPVLELVDTGVEVAVGGVPTADVLHHHEVAGSGQLYGVSIDRVDVGVLVVRLARQQHGVRTIVWRPVDIGSQHDAVPHPSRHIVLDEDALARAGRRSDVHTADWTLVLLPRSFRCTL